MGRRILRVAILVVVLALLAGWGFVVLMEDRLLYHPERGAVGPSPGEEVPLTASDGVRLHAWWVPHPEAAVALLYFHGNAGHIGHRRAFIEELRDLPASVLALSWRGYGPSEGEPSEEGLYRDARAAYDWVAARFPPTRIVAYGESLGGGPACELATQVPLGGVILRSTFTSLPDMSRAVLPWFPAHWFLRQRYDNLAKIGRIACPKLVIHARNDEVVPFSMGERLFAAAPEPRRSAWFDRGGHNGVAGANARAYLEALRAFLADVAR